MHMLIYRFIVIFSGIWAARSVKNVKFQFQSKNIAEVKLSKIQNKSRFETHLQIICKPNGISCKNKTNT